MFAKPLSTLTTPEFGCTAASAVSLDELLMHSSAEPGVDTRVSQVHSGFEWPGWGAKVM